MNNARNCQSKDPITTIKLASIVLRIFNSKLLLILITKDTYENNGRSLLPREKLKLQELCSYLPKKALKAN